MENKENTQLSNLSEYLESIENDLRSINSKFDNISIEELENMDDKQKEEILSQISGEEIKSIFDIFNVISDNLKNIDINKEIKSLNK